ncbi:MAG: PQQ-binding-like beta-propeller repeat protein [Aureliella sp.]
MQERASKFIDILEAEGLLSPEVIDELRRQVSESKTRLKPELLAKLLVDNGHLTKFQATKLISSMSDDAPEAAADSPDGSQNDDLGFADDEAAADKSNTNTAKVILDDEDTAAAVEPVEVIETVPVVESVEALETVEVIQSVESASSENAMAAELDDFTEDSASAALDSVDVPRPQPVRRTSVSQDNPWDSFRILGVGVLLALVLIAGYFLVYYFARGSADDALERAENAYESRSYETAATMYEEFANSWPTHDKSSFARVRSALAKLRKDAEGAPDPSIGLQTAVDVLPGITDEEALNEERGDLAGALISLAGKFNDRADSRETTAERKELMDDMGRLMEMIEDPKFVGQAQRNQQAPTLDKIEENRKRILREINRDERLAVALATIDEKLAAKDTQGAYDVRAELISLYPLLETNEGVQQRVLEASKIQQSLVQPGGLNPSVSTSEPQTSVGDSFLLANNTGKTANDLAGRVVFAKVKGSVYGLDGESGRVLWRKFVGRGLASEAVPVSDAANADVLISEPTPGRLSRVDARTGSTKWIVDFETPIHVPVVESQELFVATLDGEVVCLDINSGQIIWNQRLPQSLSVPPGTAFGKTKLYVPADHTNLYVLSRQSGECAEVQYIGHQSGSVRVPPLMLLGQLFLFENINQTSSKVRVFSTDDQGSSVTEAQIPIAVEGNIAVAPQIDGRRLIVQSDLGQLLALDIEPTAKNDKVSLIASRAKNVLTPQLSWLVASNNKLWVADNRLARFELQVSMGKLGDSWSKHDGDLFTSAPQKFGDTIVHTRTIRGSRGVRVSAADAKSGDTIWETDLGVPVTHLQRVGNSMAAINSSAMLFSLDKEKVKNAASANPGKGRPQLNFGSPITLDDDSVVLFNQSKPNQFARYSNGNGRILSANLGGARPTAVPVGLGDRIAVALSNGQVLLLNPQNGSVASTPYQPSIKSQSTVNWNTPAYFPENRQLFVASNLQKLIKLTAGGSLRSLGEKDLENPISGPLAAFGDYVVAVRTTSAGDEVTFFDANSMELVNSIATQGRVVSGPHIVGDFCIVQAGENLLAFDTNGSKAWSMPFSKSRLVGAPVEQNGSLLLGTISGEIWMYDLASGELNANLDTRQELSSAPQLVGQGILVGSGEGAVLAIRKPTKVMLGSGSGGAQ